MEILFFFLGLGFAPVIGILSGIYVSGFIATKFNIESMTWRIIIGIVVGILVTLFIWLQLTLGNLQ